MLWHAMVQLDAQIFSRLRRFRQKNLSSERPVSSSFTTSKSASRVDVSSKRVTRRPGCRELLMKSAGTSKKQTEPKLAKGASSRSTGIHLNIFQTYHIYIYPYIHWHSDWNGKSISKLAGKLTCGKSPCVMSKSTISIDSMAMFNSFFYVYQRVHPINIPLNHDYPIKSL